MESEFVSYHISEWIDLIFGYKQRGEEAEKADNLFESLTYDDYVYDDFNEDKKQVILLKIMELGQAPRKLFDKEHPKKKISTVKIKGAPQEDLKKQVHCQKEENEKQLKILKSLEKEKETEKENIDARCKELLQDNQEVLDKLRR